MTGRRGAAGSTGKMEPLISGGVVQYRNYEQSLRENAPSNILNPAVGPHMDLAFRHSLLRRSSPILIQKFSG